jgi:resuscitation-promoting factor RpfB
MPFYELSTKPPVPVNKFVVQISRCLPFLLLAVILAACQPASDQAVILSIPVTVDGQQVTITTESGQSVDEALSNSGIKLGDLDRTVPARDTQLTANIAILVTRVEHVMETREEEIPFKTNILPNETMVLGEQQIIQPGLNGLQEVTYQHVIEDGEEITTSIAARTILREPQNEIIMEGVQSPNVPVTLNGKLAFLTAGNAWVMDGSTIVRQPVVTTGDLDKRIFELSASGDWLLFTRKAQEGEQAVINTLWVINTSDPDAEAIDLGVNNVIHFADWLPSEERAIVFSTVEMRTTAPGWQANNDLQIIRFTEDGGVFAPVSWLEPNAGGLYGWWGDDFLFQPGTDNITILRPDGIDLLALGRDEIAPLAEILSYQTHGSWAWVTQASWSMDGSVLYAVNHRDDGSNSPEESTHFDLDVFFPSDHAWRTLRQDVGMFAYPSLSPDYETGNKLGYLQASFPQESDTSPYRLKIMDVDGSGEKEVFPREGATGMLPQVVQWQPAGNGTGDILIAVVYLGNIWLVDVNTGDLQQVTGDGLTEKISWK